MTERLTRPTWLSRPWRKTLLVLHMVSGTGWMGLDVALLVLTSAVVLSVFTPWGLTPWTPNPTRSRSSGSGALRGSQSPTA